MSARTKSRFQRRELSKTSLKKEAELQEPTGKTEAESDTLSSQTDTTLQDESIYECTVPPTNVFQMMAEVEWFRNEKAEDILDLAGEAAKGMAERPCVDKTGEKNATSPPYMQVPLEDVQVRCGEMAKFHAIIEGNPQPVVGWFKGISLLLSSERIYQFNEGTSYSLILYNTQAEDGGVYTCMAKNMGGEVICKAELVVQEDKKSQEAKKRSPRRKLHSFYEVKQEIGRGSFSILKRVIHKGNRMPCAAKFIPLRSRLREQAYRERDILVQLSHDRITQLLDQFETRKTLILILELCSNEELLDRLYKKNVVTEAEVKFYIKQLLEGILYLHNNEILHLDIKPSNVLMVHNDRDDIKICDFGFSQKINPFEPQYSTYGSPEFVSPEILSRSPVSTASDIWPVGVICYLSLTCKSPFAGENDRATLLNVQRGIISWDSSDWDHLSKEAKDFILKILQPAPGTRPSAMECLSHTWFAHNPPPEDAHFIDTKQLNFFVSRSRWQRSLMSYKSVLVMRPIPEILEKHHKNTSLGISRQLVEESSSSSTSGSSSDNEISVSSGRKPFGPIPELHLSVLEGSNYPEYEEFGAEFKIPEDSMPPIKRLKQTSAKGQLDGQPVQERETSVYQQPETHGKELFELASLQDKAGLLLPEEGRMERSPGCVPRHSVIKSTFYSQPSDGLTDAPSSPGKEQRKQLERAKRSYRKAGYSKSALSGLREPLLEQFEFGGEGGSLADAEFGKGREGGNGPLMTKSASFDTAQKSPKVTFQVSTRSRSLDDYRIRATGFAEEQQIAEEDMDIIPQGSLAEVTHLRDEEAFATKTREGFSEDQPMLVTLDEKESSSLSLQQQEKALVWAQGPEKDEDLFQKQKAPLFVGQSLQGSEDLILAAQQPGLTSGLAPKCEIEEGQTSLSSTHRDMGAIFQKGESSVLRDAQLETTNLVSQDHKEEKLSHETKPSSPKSEEDHTPQQEENFHFLKSVPFHITHVQAEKQLAGAPDKSPKTLQTVAMSEGHLPGYQKPLVYPETQTVESRSSSAPILYTDISASSIPEEEQQILSQKPSGLSLAKSAMLENKGLENLNFPQAKMASTSVSESAKQKHLHQLPIAHTERKLPIAKGEGPVQPEMVPMEEGQHPSQQESSVYSKPSSSALRSAASFIQAAFQPGVTSISLLHGETQMASLPKPSIYPEGESLLREVQSPPQQAETPIPACESQDLGHGKSLKNSEFASVIPKGQRPQIKTDLTSVFEAENHELYPHVPSAPSEVKSAILKGQTPSVAGFSQAKMAPTSVSESAEQKHLHQLPIAHTERKLPVAKGEGPVHPEMVPMEEGQHPPQQESSVYSKPSSSALRSAASFIQAAFQPGATSISLLHEETQMASLPKPSIYPEGESLLKEVQSPPQQAETLTSAYESQDWGHGKSLKTSEFASVIPKGQRPQIKTDLTSVFEGENHELYPHVPSAPSEVRLAILKGPTSSAAGFSQAKIRPFSTSGEKIPVTVKKTPYSIGEGKSKEHMMHEKLYLYINPEAQALEDLSEEMAYLPKATTPLAESVPAPEGSKRYISPQGEMFYQDSPGQAVRPKGRYLVRRGKREGGIGLADPTEADIIYPGEEDYFSVQSYLSKKVRMSSPYEGQGLDYTGAETSTASLFDRLSYYAGRQGSNWMYEIALVQIQDLSELPRPDSKTAKFDISEVEPAFLNLHELYDIVYSPFEFLSFRKAPENLPSKRHLPPGFKLHSQQDKKICLREDNLQGEAIRKPFGEEEKDAVKVEVGPEPAIAPRIGKRSDSEGDLPIGSQQMYDLPSDPTRKRKSSLQSALGLFKPVVRSQSMEQVEQSLKKRMKASVAHFSRMLTRKLSSEEHREDSEEPKSEQAERTSLTEPSPTSKKKRMFPSFTLPSLKTKDKGPFFVEELTDQTVAIGQSLTLSCRTSAHSFSRVEWFKDGAGICSTDRILISSTLKRFQLLTVLSATMEDFGMYTCTATGSHGTISTSCTIRKAEAPSNPPSPDIVEVLEDGVQLAWEPVELNTPVTYTVLCKKDDGEWKTLASDLLDCCYTVEHLPRGLVYSFRIACVSPAGVGPYSYPTPKVKIGEQDQAAFQAQDEEDKMTAQPTHQTYAFQTEIKRGRFSIIKQCREKFSGNPLAAKIIPYRQEEKEAVLQEYQILRKLHHTNIGQLQGAYVSPRHLVLIVELCVGPELLHALAGRSSYSEVQVRDYLWQILSAVEYLHKQDILHLDLRSENMIIVEPNLLKLLDFGNAQFYMPDQIITLDGCTDYVETMASELLSDKGAVPQTDIWAIGVTAFIMLSAEYPISSEAAWDFGRLVKRDKIRLNKCYAGLSGGAINFLQSTLSFNPWRRPTATECLQSSWLQETGLDEHQQATVTFSTTKLRNFVAARERKRALLCSKYGVTAV